MYCLTNHVCFAPSSSCVTHNVANACGSLCKQLEPIVLCHATQEPVRGACLLSNLRHKLRAPVRRLQWAQKAQLALQCVCRSMMQSSADQTDANRCACWPLTCLSTEPFRWQRVRSRFACAARWRCEIHHSTAASQTCAPVLCRRVI